MGKLALRNVKYEARAFEKVSLESPRQEPLQSFRIKDETQIA